MKIAQPFALWKRAGRQAKGIAAACGMPVGTFYAKAARLEKSG